MASSPNSKVIVQDAYRPDMSKEEEDAYFRARVAAAGMPYISREEARKQSKVLQFTGSIDPGPSKLGPHPFDSAVPRPRSDVTVKSDGRRQKPYKCAYHASLPSVPRDSKIQISGPGPIPFMPKDLTRGYTLEESERLLRILEERRRFQETCGCDPINPFLF